MLFNYCKESLLLLFLLLLSLQGQSAMQTYKNTFLLGKLNKNIAGFIISIITAGSLPIDHALATIATTPSGITNIDGELLRVYKQARQNEQDGSFPEAQKLYEQVVQTEPDYIYGWSSLGNVLTARGDLDIALKCYRKAVSLRPPNNELSNILLNMASIELATDKTADSLKDLGLAERLAGSTSPILTVKAVALTNLGEWKQSAGIFEEVISTADKNANPWWLRYSMALLETSRGTEAIAFLQRTLNRFPDETECKAFAAALYTSQGSALEGSKYWKQIPVDERGAYKDLEFLKTRLKWGPVAIANFEKFLSSKYSVI